MANPIEVTYQIGRYIFAVRVARVAGASLYYNTVTGLYEAPLIGNALNYAIVIPEVFQGYYAVDVPAGSLSLPATEVIYEAQNGSSVQITDFNFAPIATGSSQGVDIQSSGGTPSGGTFNPTAVVDIVNLALTHIGQKVISAITDATENARKANLIFSNCVEEVLRDCDWNFSTTIIELTENSDQVTNAVPGWTYVYELPSDMVKARRVYIQSAPIFSVTPPPSPDLLPIPVTNPPTVPYRIIYSPILLRRIIVSNVNPAYMEYTAFIQDITLWDPMFIKALTYKLASELAVVLNGKQETADKNAQKYQVWVSEAMKVNGVETGVPPIALSNFVEARA